MDWIANNLPTWWQILIAVAVVYAWQQFKRQLLPNRPRPLWMRVRDSLRRKQ